MCGIRQPLVLMWTNKSCEPFEANCLHYNFLRGARRDSGSPPHPPSPPNHTHTTDHHSTWAAASSNYFTPVSLVVHPFPLNYQSCIGLVLVSASLIMHQGKSGDGLHLGLSLTESEPTLPLIRVTLHIATSSPPSQPPLDKDGLQRWDYSKRHDWRYYTWKLFCQSRVWIASFFLSFLFFTSGWIGNVSPCSNQLIMHYVVELTASVWLGVQQWCLMSKEISLMKLYVTKIIK